MIDTRTSISQLQVLLLTAEPDICKSLRDRFKVEGLACIAMPVADYTLKVIMPSGVGTAIVDMKGLNEGQREILSTVIKRLIADDVPVVLLHASGESRNWKRGIVQELDSPTPDMIAGVVLAHLAMRKAGLSDREAAVNVSSELTEQLKMAGRVQRDFLPARLPDSDHYRWATVFRPADWVSGDIYDVARLDENHVGFYLADAVGHSMPAALLTMFLKHGIVMRETVGNTWRIFEPVEVISRLNVFMAEQGLSGCQFATICYCLLNTATRELRFTRAGHPYPVLTRADGTLRTLESRGPLLGVFKDSQYVQEQVTLEKGDKLFLYSDGAEGIVGAADENGAFEFYPSFKSMSRMPIGEMMTQFDEAAEGYEFADGTKDDITALGIEAL
jgi:sigma-B regulation protein RsbU (phosphoserine phosphatase)